MAASQKDVHEQVRLVQIQAAVAPARSFKHRAHLPGNDNVREILYQLGQTYEDAAIRMNDKWQLHECIDFIDI